MNALTRILKSARPEKFVLALLAAAAIAGCGGGGNVAGGGIGGTGISTGSITGFGSTKQNGVTFEDGNATIIIDDNPGLKSQLQVGQVVKISFNSNNGTTGVATKIELDHEVEGAIESIDDPNQQLVILKQLVQVTGDTSFVGVADLAALNPGPGVCVEVNGFRNGATIVATFIESKACGQVELKGTVSALSGTTFKIGTQDVDFTGANLVDFPGGVVAPEQFVEVAGNLNGNVLQATRVQFEGQTLGSSGQKVEIEGFVTELGVGFKVAGQQVSTNGTTVFEPAGYSPANGDKVEVEGTISGSTLIATKVARRNQANVRIEANVTGVNSTNSTVTLFGKVVTITANTQMEDKVTGAQDKSLVFGDIAAGNRLAIRAWLDTTTNALIATRVEREDPPADPTEVTLQGPVSFETPTTSFVILPNLPGIGTTVLVQDGTTDFQRVDDTSFPNALEFFNAVRTTAPATIVKAEGHDLGGQLDARSAGDEVEIEVP